MNSIISAASKVLRLQDDVKKATTILEDILVLQPIDQEIEPNVENYLQHELTKIIQGCPVRESTSNNSTKSTVEDDLCELNNYTCLSLSKSFYLCSNGRNFNIAEPTRWIQLLEALTDSVSFAVVVQIILTLSNISLINKQTLGELGKVRILLFEILSNKNDTWKSILLQRNLIEWYTSMLSVDCSPLELENLYLHKNSKFCNDILNSLTLQVSDPRSQNYLQFENSYKLFQIQKSSKINHSFLFYIEFNSVTSNRIMTIERHIYLEIKEGQFCVSNDNYIIGLFENFEFEVGNLYFIAVIIDHNNQITLYVDGSMINQLTLFENSVCQLNTCELGSMICSIKLYRFYLWDGLLTEFAINVLQAIGTYYQYTFSKKKESIDVLSNCQDFLIAKAHLMNRPPTGISSAKYISEIELLEMENIIIDVNPNDILQDFTKLSNFTIRFEENINSKDIPEVGKCYLYQSSNLISKFVSIDSIRLAFLNMAECDSMDDLFHHVSHLMNLLRNIDILSWFKKDFGFPLFAYTLKQKITQDLSQPLSIQFFNLFLEFCGWDFNDISKSIILDTDAYENIVLNLDLWYMNEDQSALASGGLEIIRFLFFQISSLMEASIYSKFNSNKFNDMNILEKLCLSYQAVIKKENPNSKFGELSNDLISVLVTLLKYNTDKRHLQWFLHLSYYFIKKKDVHSTEIILQAIDQLFSFYLDQGNDENARVLSEIIPLKLMLMNMDQLVENNESNPITCLNILFKIVLINKPLFKQFYKNDGLKLILTMLCKVGKSYREEIISLLLIYSMGNYTTANEIFSGTENNMIRGVPNNKITVKEIVYLAVSFIEWHVINSNSSDSSSLSDLNNHISRFIEDLESLSTIPINASVFDPRNSYVIVSLLDLLIALSESEDISKFKSSSKMISRLIKSNILYALTKYAAYDFEVYMSTFFCHITEYKLVHPKTVINNSSYLQVSFMITLLPEILNDLVGSDNKLNSMMLKYPYMMSNLLYLLRKFRPNTSQIVMPREFYFSSYVCLLHCVIQIDKSSFYHFKNVSKSQLLQDFKLCILNLLYFNTTKKTIWEKQDYEIFSESLMLHQEILFAHGACDNETIGLLLMFLANRLRDCGYNKVVFNCIKVIIKNRERKLKEVANFFDAINKSEVLDGLSYILSCSNPEAMNFITEQCSFFFNNTQQVRFKNTITNNLFKSNNFSALSIRQVNNQVYEWKSARFEFMTQNNKKCLILFRKDNTSLDFKIKKSISRYIYNLKTDREENAVFYRNNMNLLIFHLKHTLEIQSNHNLSCKWSLDFAEDFDGMKRRLLPAWEPKNEPLLNEEDTNQETIASGNRQRRESGSILSYEFIEHIETLESEPAGDLNENRKILRLLKDNDSIATIWNCSLIIGLEIKEGILIRGNNYLYFVSDYYFSSDDKKILKLSEVSQELRDMTVSLINGPDVKKLSTFLKHEVFVWKLLDLTFVTKRPFLLRDVAIELLFKERVSAFFSFYNKRVRDDVLRVLNKIPKHLPSDPIFSSVLQEINNRGNSIVTKNGMGRASIASKFTSVFSANNSLIDGFELSKKWVKGEISNFYYLLSINTLAGRSFNDLTQYPVFPWVIADYESDVLDLKNPKTYRDLSKPMGAQTEKRKLQFIERYEALASLENAGSAPFHYGTHYSSAMIVSSYLIRLKPFVESFLLLQGGSFGPADRLFSSLERAWSSASSENTTDVRELTPEFFFLPEFLTNVNNYDFGTDQSGKKVDDVVLPPWANGDAKVFIQKNREALESPYVSAHLHEWIDLIFGYKQKGEIAVESVNVFNRLSYPGAVNLDNIGDENERRAITGIIHNFGQTPLQIFQEPHPEKAACNIRQLTTEVWRKIPMKPIFEKAIFNLNEKNTSVDYVIHDPSYFDSLYWRGFAFPNLLFRTEETLVSLRIVHKSWLKIGLDIFKKTHMTQITSFAYWKLGEFITGDKNGLIKVWKYRKDKHSASGNLENKKTMFGHLCELKEMRCYHDYNTLLTLDINGSVYVWDMINFELVRQITNNAHKVAISQHTGSIMVLTKTNAILIFNLNGQKYTSKEFGPAKIVSSIEFFDFTKLEAEYRKHIYWKEMEILLVGFDDGTIDIYELFLTSYNEWAIKLLKQLSTERGKAITSIKAQGKTYLSQKRHKDSTEPDEIEVIAGTLDGRLAIWY
ncbi:Bph1p [Saccharomyces paradoxus]|uniref:Beige protein homolog 1 n=1 Tax=Saccharomyces paradoxus TaxID=27291 RepID=A0A8B8UMH6_SACPA|nr:Bph1 [Saccharomyces paradoxus]QHS71942.1 Bph1 [Saccharomyces paradoxus]